MDADFWDTIRQLVGWLDENRQLTPREELLARVMKITEESGEVVEAVLGALGQNPRKGKTNDFDKVTAELTDVILSAAVALYTVEGASAGEAFAANLARVAGRSLGVPAQA